MACIFLKVSQSHDLKGKIIGGMGFSFPYIEREIQTQYVTLLEQRLKIHVFSALLMLNVELPPIVIAYLHPKRPSLVRHVPPDPAHAKDTQGLVPGVVAERRRRVTPPLTPPQRGHALRQVPQGAQQEEDANVGGGVVDGRGRVGNANFALRAGVDVDLVVAGAVVADELARGGQGVQDGRIDEAGDGDGFKGAVDGDDAVECAGLDLFDEIIAVGGFGLHNGCDIGQRGPVVLNTMRGGNLASEIHSRPPFNSSSQVQDHTDYRIRSNCRTLGFSSEPIMESWRQ